MNSSLAGGWLEGNGTPTNPHASLRGQKEKVERVSELARFAEQQGVSLAHLSMAFTLAHPAVTAAVVDVHTVDELRETLRGAALELDDATLDRLDEIVKPGRDVAAGDTGWDTPVLAHAALRRRRSGARAVA